MPRCPGCNEEYPKGGAFTTHVEHCDRVEKEQHERIEQTRATIIGVLEALDETDMTDEVLELAENLCQPNILAKNQEIIEHLLEKAKSGEPLNEADKLLAEIVMKTEQEREGEQSPAAEIAQGLFAQTERTTAERTTSEQKASSKRASAGKSSSESTNQEQDEQKSDSVTVSTEMSDERL